MKAISKYDFGDIVYLKTDPEQLERMVTGFTVRPNNTVMLLLTTSDSEETSHFEWEVSINKNITKTLELN